jgi:UDP-N-acetylglucosamine--N-acetylmuramyl-(pentapeptide) pyrophosphoryl-undecaprenol N-acetylglucosamine transferase
MSAAAALGSQLAARLDATVLIMAGGTGGHVFPALAVAAALRAIGARVVWLGTAAGLEVRAVPEAGIELHCVRIAGLRRRGAWRWLLAPLTLGVALVEALAIVARVRPALVLGFGGYASGPGGIAAWLTRRALVVHEQNAVPGLTNRLLCRVADRVLEAFPGSFPRSVGALRTGNPVRAEFAAIAAPADRLGARDGPLRVLVVGGSQGARALNEIVPGAIALLPGACPVEVHHQSGEAELEATRERYRVLGARAEVSAFIDAIAAAYAWADVVICRAGAMTVAELAAAGAPAILVPYPHAVDDHQTRNARYLVEAGAALLLPQAELEPARLADWIAGLHAARGRLLEMAECARRVALPDATERVVAACVEVARG